MRMCECVIYDTHPPNYRLPRARRHCESGSVNEPHSIFSNTPLVSSTMQHLVSRNFKFDFKFTEITYIRCWLCFNEPNTNDGLIMISYLKICSHALLPDRLDLKTSICLLESLLPVTGSPTASTSSSTVRIMIVIRWCTACQMG